MKLALSPILLVLVPSALVSVGLSVRPAVGQGTLPAGLTPEQAEILSHMHLVYPNDIRGGSAPTLVFSGLNVQIVNGLDATNGYPRDPNTLDPTLVQTNGAGNLILGYNEVGVSTGARTDLIA